MLQQAAVVEPAHPFERGELHGLASSPGSASVNDVSLEQAVDGLGQSVVITVADGEAGPWPRRGRVSPPSDGWFDAGFGEAFGVLDGQVLRSPVGVVDETGAGPALMDGLLQGVQNEARMGGSADAPAHGEA